MCWPNSSRCGDGRAAGRRGQEEVDKGERAEKSRGQPPLDGLGKHKTGM